MITPQDIKDFLSGLQFDVTAIPDGFIQGKIDATIVRIEKETGKSFFENREVIEITSAYGSYTLQLMHFPITEITEVEILKDYLNTPPELDTYGRKIQTEDYVANLESGQITFKSTLAWFPEDENSVKVTYKYGYTMAPADALDGLKSLIAAACLKKASSIEGDEKSKSIEGWSVTYSGDSKFEKLVSSFEIDGMVALANYYEAIL